MTSTPPYDRRAPWHARVHATAILITCALALYTVYATCRLVYLSYAPLPFWDQWFALPGADHLAHPFAQHNEHRIVFSRLIFALDDSLFGGRNIFNIVVILVITFGHALLLAELARRSEREPRSRQRTAWLYAVAFGLMLASAQWENLVWGFQHQFVGVYAFASATFAALALGTGVRSLALVSILACVTSFTMSNGLQVPVLLVVLAVFLRRPRAHIAWLAALAAMLVAFYMHDFEMPGHHAKPLESIRDPLHLILYVATYVRLPFAVFWGSVANAAATGFVVIAANVALAVHAWKRRDSMPRAAIALLSTSIFVLSTACVTGLGRLSFGVEQALSSRYATPALVLWTSTLLQIFVIVPSRRRVAHGALIVLAIAALTTSSFRKYYNHARSHGDSLRVAETALLSGAVDDAAFEGVSPSSEVVAASRAPMRAAHVSVFAEPWSHFLGAPLRTKVRFDRGACTGVFETIQAVPSGHGPAFRVKGWAFLPRTRTRPLRVVITDARGIVIGYAFTGDLRSEIGRRDPRVTNTRVGFIGHVGDQLRFPNVLKAYALLDDRTACEIPGSLAVDHISPIPAVAEGALGAPVPTTPTAASRDFPETGFNTALDDRPAPPGARGSFHEGPEAAFTGSHRVTGTLPAGTRRIALWVMAGPHTFRTSTIRVRGLVSGELWGELSDLTLFDHARWWLIDVPENAEATAFEVVANDAGRAPEAWLGFATPRVVPAP